jgi:hypothetical protein
MYIFRMPRSALCTVCCHNKRESDMFESQYPADLLFAGIKKSDQSM